MRFGTNRDIFRTRPGKGATRKLDESMVQERKADLQPVGHAADVGVAEQGIAEVEAQLELRNLVE